MIFTCLTFTLTAYSQKALQCECLENLEMTIQKTEANYAGFPAKVNPKTRPSYEALVKNLRSRAAAEKGAKNCFYLIRDYVNFFRDKHFSFSYYNREDADSEQLDVHAQTFSGRQIVGVEGIWVNPDSSVKVGILQVSKGLFKAAVIESKDKNHRPGQVIFTLKQHPKGYVYTAFDSFASTQLYSKQRGNLLQHWGFELWGRTSPKAMTAAEQKELALWRNNNKGLDFRKIDSETTLLKIPTFFNNDNRIEALVSKNDAEIRNTENLIVDLRGNGGGNTGWIYFLPYLITNDIKQDVTQLRVSEDNVKLKISELEPVVKNPVPAELKKYFTDDYMAEVNKAYRELPVTTQAFYPLSGPGIPLDSVAKKPKKVALIVDDLCGSSSEYFFWMIAQSKKTVRYGTNTVGMMDYEGPSSRTTLPLGNFILFIPTTRSGWTASRPIDQTGFTPDVKINLPEDKWIEFVTKDLKKRK